MLRRHPSTKASFSMVTVKEHNDNDTIRRTMIPAKPSGGACRPKKQSWSLPCRVGLAWGLDWDGWGGWCADDLTPPLYIEVGKQLVNLSANSTIMKPSHVGKLPSAGLQGVVTEDQGCKPHLVFMVWKHANHKRTHKPVDSNCINEVQSYSHTLPKPH